jgi:hypothetical protein
MRRAEIALEDLPAEGAYAVTGVEECEREREVVIICSADGVTKIFAAEAARVHESVVVVDKICHTEDGAET